MIFPNHKVILFPLETYVREIDFRLALAFNILRPGRQIILGNHTDIYHLTMQLKNAVYVGKCLHNVSPTRPRECYDHAKKSHTKIIYLHEEGGVFENDIEHIKAGLFRRLQPDWLSAEDYFCAWGEVQSQIYKDSSPTFKNNIYITGHPRFDLCSDKFKPLYQEEICELKNKFGPFLLINTNFSRFTRIGGNGCYFGPPWTPKNDEIKIKQAADYLGYDANQFSGFIKLIAAIEKRFPDLNIVIRPHPSEDTRYFSDVFAHFKKVHIAREGNLISWLRACQTLIHSGCTTGIEGCLCGTKVIAYDFQKDSPFLKNLPNLAGRQANNEEEVLNFLADDSWKGGIESLSANSNKQLTSFFTNFQNNHDSFATLSEIVDLCLQDSIETTVCKPIGNHIWKGRSQAIKNCLRSILPNSLHFKSNQNLHAKQKFPGFNINKINYKTNILSQIYGKEIRVKKINNMLISLSI